MDHHESNRSSSEERFFVACKMLYWYNEFMEIALVSSLVDYFVKRCLKMSALTVIETADKRKIKVADIKKDYIMNIIKASALCKI